MAHRLGRANRREASTDRRSFLARSVASACALGCPALLGAAPLTAARHRVAVIGHTGRGDYGHGLDEVWQEVAGARVVAVADADQQVLAKAVQRLRNPKGYLDYRRMLDEIKPDFVSVAPRWIDQHRDMVVAAAERGVRGIYLEKPLCRTLAEADEMVAACEKHKVKLAIAFQTRYSQKLPVVRELIASGRLGQVIEYRARGKEDHRGGGEDLWVLGIHMFNLMQHFAGVAQWCFGAVEQDGHPVGPADVKPGAEGIGPLAGDKVHAVYRLASGAYGYFDSSRRAGGRPTRFGLQIFGTEGVLQMFDTGHLPEMYFLADSAWAPGRTGKAWAPVSSAGVGKPEPLENRGLAGGNLLAVQALIQAAEHDGQPASSIYEARSALEMIVAVFESHRLGKPVTLPLGTRQNPLTLLQ